MLVVPGLACQRGATAGEEPHAAGTEQVVWQSRHSLCQLHRDTATEQVWHCASTGLQGTLQKKTAVRHRARGAQARCPSAIVITR